MRVVFGLFRVSGGVRVAVGRHSVTMRVTRPAPPLPFALCPVDRRHGHVLTGRACGVCVDNASRAWAMRADDAVPFGYTDDDTADIARPTCDTCGGPRATYATTCATCVIADADAMFDRR